MARKKWKISELEDSKHLKKTANLILHNRISSLVNFIDFYFKEKSVENLHDVRIALRRVRYSMELFFVCYDKKLFMRLYYKIQQLQDLSGLIRDLDVFKENISQLEKEKVNINSEILTNVDEKKRVLEEKFELELMRFKHSKVLKDFIKIISK